MWMRIYWTFSSFSFFVIHRCVETSPLFIVLSLVCTTRWIRIRIIYTLDVFYFASLFCNSDMLLKLLRCVFSFFLLFFFLCCFVVAGPAWPPQFARSHGGLPAGGRRVEAAAVGGSPSGRFEGFRECCGHTRSICGQDMISIFMVVFFWSVLNRSVIGFESICNRFWIDLIGF